MTDMIERAADAIRKATCTGDCGLTEEECAKERIQPFVWHHGRLAVVEGEPEMFAAVVLAELKPELDALARIARIADEYPAGIDTALVLEALDTTPTPAAHDAGPSVAECAASDRRWPLQKNGE